jgi:ribonuclease HI
MPYASRPVRKKYYVIWKGRKTGIFNTWDETAAQVNGFTGAEYMAFESRVEAEKAFKGQYTDFMSSRPAKPPKRPPSAGAATGPILDSYCVDAAASGNPGPVEYRCVYTANKKEIFHQGPFQNGTNNIGEFLAIVHALAYLKGKDLLQPIYTDSKIAALWVRAKKCKTKLLPNALNAPLFDLIVRAEDWLKTNSYENKILKWDTGAWGEIPADFGRK